MLEGRYENLHFFTSRNVKIENMRETLVIVNDLVSCLLDVNDIWDDEEGNGSDANCIEIAKVHRACETAQIAMTVEMMFEEKG